MYKTRKQNGQTVTVYMLNEHYNFIEQYAVENGLSFSKANNYLLEVAIKNLKEEETK
jgi:hypothetical protein